MWLHPGSSPPDLVRRDLGLVNSYHSCYCIRLDQDLLPWWMQKSLNSGAAQVFGEQKSNPLNAMGYLQGKRKVWLWRDVITPWQQSTWSCSPESWPCEFVSLVLLHSPWSGSAALVDVFIFCCYGDTKTESDNRLLIPKTTSLSDRSILGEKVRSIK